LETEDYDLESDFKYGKFLEKFVSTSDRGATELEQENMRLSKENTSLAEMLD
jgi:hypothetical protein